MKPRRFIAGLILQLLFPLAVIQALDPISDRIDALTEAIIDPEPAFAAYPNIREGRQNGLSSLTDALSNGGSNGFLSSIFSGITKAFSSFSSVVPSLSANSFGANMKKGQELSEGPMGFKPPRTSKPGPEVFEKWNARKRKLKGRAKRQVISVKSLKQYGFGSSQNAVGGTPMGGVLMTVLSALSKMFNSVGSVTKSPTNRISDKMMAYRNDAKVMISQAEGLPNHVFGTFRSKREADDRENEVKFSLVEVAVAHQKNWFNYLNSYKSSSIQCQEWDFCRIAQENNAFTTSAAQHGGKLLSYITAGLKDSRGQYGERLVQAVDCCLSDSSQQAEACARFYRESCLQADPFYVLYPKD